MSTKQHDLGNNESVATGYEAVPPGQYGNLPRGGFVALTRTQSATFKTERGAIAWLARRGYNPDGTRA